MRWSLLACLVLFSCKDSTPSNVEPLVFQGTKCVVGGTKPALFVWAESAVGVKLTHLRATKFELRNKQGVLVNGVSGPLLLRARAGANGEGDVRSISSGLEPGTVHLEVFGELAFDAYGSSVTYPTEPRSFQAQLESDQGSFALTGLCEVGVAG